MLRHRTLIRFTRPLAASMCFVALLLAAPLLPSLFLPAESRAADEADASSRLASEVKELFRVRCLECHGGAAANGGVRILERELLVEKKKVVPGKPDESPLYRYLTADDDSVMPPAGQPRLSEREVAAVRRWILDGAAPFPADVVRPDGPPADPGLQGVLGIEYVLKKILAHVRDLPEQNRVYVRYFSINHLVVRGVTREELVLHRDALAKAVNHLSNEPQIAPLDVVDEPAATIFAVDIRRLGWHNQPFERIIDGKPAGRSTLNLFDVALLEYPYATIYESSSLWDRVLEEYVVPAGLVRPVPFVRADWFACVATQPPLYDDLLQLPRTLPELERRLGVPSEANVANGIARRAGMTVSGVSRNNRVVERHPSSGGAYWKSFDFATSKGRENMFLDPVRLDAAAAGGEVIFNLPNGLQGYYLANGKGDRVNDAPTSIVTDKFAEDKTVRNGLACMRCHDQGMKEFVDTVRAAAQKAADRPGFSKRETLDLYAPADEMDRLLKQDAARFLAALTTALGKPQQAEPLIPVSRRFLEAPIPLTAAAAELGLPDTQGLEAVFRAPQFTGLGLMPLASGGVVRRDMWEDYFDDVVHHLGLGTPVIPIDGLTRPDLRPPANDVEIALETNRKNNVFAPGDELSITVTNRSIQPAYVELFGGGTDGTRAALVPPTLVKAGDHIRFPSRGALKVRGGLGREEITVFASRAEIPRGEVLRGKNLGDRVVHDFYRTERTNGRLVVVNRALGVVRKTIVIETR